MRETVELRIPEKNAALYLRPNEGRILGSKWEIELAGPSVRTLELDISSPRYEEIGLIHKHLRDRGKYLFLGWGINRNYTLKELEAAEMFQLKITAVFEPAGELCGTVYDEGDVCSFCKSGRRQLSDLTLDLRRAPKNKHFARTIADEWIVSQPLAELLVDAAVTGIEFRPVRHKARYQDDPVDLGRLPSGRELLKRAETLGIKYNSGEFYVWLNRPEQRMLYDRAIEEKVVVAETSHRRRPSRLPSWYQLVVTSTPMPTIPPTRFGIAPFEDDPSGEYRCPLGHVSGLNLLSEIWIKRADWDGSDVIRTADMVGARQGVLVATPLLLISQRLRRILRDNQIRGYKLEVARLS